MRLIFGISSTLVTVITGVIAYIFLHYSSVLPSYETLKNYQPAQITRIYSSDLKLIEEYGVQKRVFVPIESIPNLVKNAFIAAEDRNYYSHSGIDFPSTIRATLYAIPRIFVKRTLKGGSTITQQVVKNLLLSHERTVDRKIKELILAAAISKKFSKDQILELYLNQIYFGLGVYGIAAASRYYFDKGVENLSVEEVAFLAGLLSSPASCDPRMNYARAKMRRNYALYRMYENNFINKKDLKKALGSEIVMKIRDSNNAFKAPYYVEKIRKIAIQKFGPEIFYSGGLTIVTTLNSQYQDWAEKSLVNGIINHDAKGGYKGPLGQIDINGNWEKKLNDFNYQLELSSDFEIAVIKSVSSSSGYFVGLKNGEIVPLSCKGPFGAVLECRGKLKIGDIVIVVRNEREYRLSQIPKCDGAIIAINPLNGKVLAMVGGCNYKSSKFDRATQAKRQIGSLVKTFVYLAALENSIEPNKIFVDEPIEIVQGSNMPSWTPRNHNNTFAGEMTMRRAFENSCNTITVKVGQLIGLHKVVNLLTRLGIDVKDEQYLSILLGCVEATLSQVIFSYGAVVNGGYAVEPNFIEYVQDSKGRILYKNCPQCVENCEFDSSNPPVFANKANTRMVDEASAYQITSMMIGAAKRGTAKSFGQNFNHIVGGKTGTTNESKEVWFVGFTNDLVVGSYVGYDIPSSLGADAYGANVTLPIVSSFMKKALYNKPVVQFKIPTSIRLQKVDPDTGLPVNDDSVSIVEALKSSATLLPELNFGQQELHKKMRTKEEDMQMDYLNESSNASGDVDILEEDLKMLDIDDIKDD